MIIDDCNCAYTTKDGVCEIIKKTCSNCRNYGYVDTEGDNYSMPICKKKKELNPNKLCKYWKCVFERKKS